MPVKRSLQLLGVVLVLLATPGAATAQSTPRLTLRHLQTETFPIISGYLEATDSTSAPIDDLLPADLQALEDGIAQPIQQLRKVETALRVIVVLNPAESFAIRDSEATTRYEYVRQVLVDWAGDLSSTTDTLLSLITPEGILVADAQAGRWLAALEAYVLPPVTPSINTQTISQAIDLAQQPADQPGTGNVILWITSTPNLESLTLIPDWQTALSERGIPLFIWQVDAPSTFESEAALLLHGLAEGSRGQMFSFSGPEVLPAPEDYFAPNRSAYYFQYTSRLRTAGTHEIAVQLLREGANSTSGPIAFNLDIQEPSPIFVAPPSQIERVPSENDPRQLAPFSQPIEIVVVFPDGFERMLRRTTLFVNGEVIAENTTAPFTRFTWDLSIYDVSQQVFLSVKVEDELGLVGSTIEFPVEIRVTTPPNWFQVFLARGAPTLALSVVIIAAGAFFLVMLLSGRLDPTRLARRSRRRPRSSPPAPDPLSDTPLSLEQNTPLGSPTSLVSLTKAAPHAPAFLQRLSIQDPGQGAQILPLDHSNLLIGSDSVCDLVLSDPSVETQHARLNRQLEGGYQLADLGSQAGTWVNYAPVSPEGSHLQDGDLVHIGRVAFRFLLNPESQDSHPE